MPYHVTTDHPDCDAFAVVNDDDGDLMGCHRTQANANEQLAALYVAEADTYPRSQPMAYERRTANDSVELRTEGETVVAVGYAAVFNSLSSNLGGFCEDIRPGAFAKTLQESDTRAMWNHDPNHLLGRVSAGTLRLAEDDHGLAYEVDLPKTTLGRDIAELLRRGDVTGSSFGFRVIEDSWGESESGFPLRTLNQVSLRDVGPVSLPAYADTEAGLRCLAEARSLDLTVLTQAAQANRLGDLIFPAPDNDDEGPGEPHPNTVRRSWAIR